MKSRPYALSQEFNLPVRQAVSYGERDRFLKEREGFQAARQDTIIVAVPSTLMCFLNNKRKPVGIWMLETEIHVDSA